MMLTIICLFLPLAIDVVDIVVIYGVYIIIFIYDVCILSFGVSHISLFFFFTVILLGRLIVSVHSWWSLVKIFSMDNQIKITFVDDHWQTQKVRAQSLA